MDDLFVFFEILGFVDTKGLCFADERIFRFFFKFVKYLFRLTNTLLILPNSLNFIFAYFEILTISLIYLE